MSNHAGWLTKSICHRDRQAAIAKAIEVLTPISDTFEHIAVTGYSGSLFGSILAHHFNKDIIVVRKALESEYRHSSRTVEHNRLCNNDKYIIVDDVIATGSTIHRIFDNLDKNYCVGIYFYHAREVFLDLLQGVPLLYPIVNEKGVKIG